MTNAKETGAEIINSFKETVEYTSDLDKILNGAPKKGVSSWYADNNFVIVHEETSEYSDNGHVVFSYKDKFYKLDFYDDSDGGRDYHRINDLVEVEPKTGTVQYFE